MNAEIMELIFVALISGALVFAGLALLANLLAALGLMLCWFRLEAFANKLFRVFGTASVLCLLPVAAAALIAAVLEIRSML